MASSEASSELCDTARALFRAEPRAETARQTGICRTQLARLHAGEAGLSYDGARALSGYALTAHGITFIPEAMAPETLFLPAHAAREPDGSLGDELHDLTVELGRALGSWDAGDWVAGLTLCWRLLRVVFSMQQEFHQRLTDR